MKVETASILFNYTYVVFLLPNRFIVFYPKMKIPTKLKFFEVDFNPFQTELYF